MASEDDEQTEISVTSQLSTEMVSNRTVFYYPNYPAEKAKREIIYPEWMYGYRHETNPQGFRNLGRVLGQMSMKDNGFRKVECRTFEEKDWLVFLTVLFTDCLGVLSKDSFTYLRCLFIEAYPYFKGNDCHSKLYAVRFMSQPSIVFILSGLLEETNNVDELNTKLNSLHYESYDDILANMGINIIELLFIADVRVCFDRVFSNMYCLRAVKDFTMGHIITWSLNIKGSYLNSQLHKTTPIKSILGSCFYCNSSGRLRNAKKHQCMAGIVSTFRINIGYVVKRSDDSTEVLVTKINVSMTFMMCETDLIRSGSQITWPYSLSYVDKSVIDYHDMGDTSGQVVDMTKHDYMELLVTTVSEIQKLEDSVTELKLNREQVL